MALREILEFLKSRRLAVEATQRAGAAPQAAVVGVVTSDELELFFDTLGDTRKAQNLRRDARIALVVGFDLDDPRTVQLQGVADEPTGADLARLKRLYLEAFPDGVERERWPGIAYFRVRPTWLRFSDFRGATPVIEELVPIGSTFDPYRSVLETRLSGKVTVEDVERWKAGLAAEIRRIPDGARFRLLSDLRGFEPVDLDAHRAMREVVPRLLAAHGLRPAVTDLFDDEPELPITTTRGVRCGAYANVHHDAEKMQSYERRVGGPVQRFFVDRAEAEAWLETVPLD